MCIRLYHHQPTSDGQFHTTSFDLCHSISPQIFNFSILSLIRTNMLINCCYLHLNLLILAFLIHFSNCNCNWLRIGVSEISLPESDYIKQFSARQSRASQTRKMNHSNNDHPSHRKPTSVNNSIAKYFNGSNDADTFLNDVTGSLQSPEAVKQLQEYDAILSQFSSAQLKFIKRNPDSLAVLSEGTSLGGFWAFENKLSLLTAARLH